MAEVTPHQNATGSWRADINLIPDPVMPMSWSRADSVGNLEGAVINDQLGATYAAGLAKLMEGAQRWRLAYAGITIYQDGPALADQGTVVAAVVPVEPYTIATVVGSDSTEPANPFWTSASNPGIRFSASDEATYENLIQMPNAYTGQSKHGVYLPLKLSTNHQQWHSERDVCNDFTGVAPIRPATVAPGATFAVPEAEVHSAFPYFGEHCCWFQPYVAEPVVEPAVFHPALRCFPCNENWGRICFRNMSVQSRITCVLRFGYEIQAQPGSPYASYLRLSPPWDPIAIQEYYAISRELKDAYPADYNDLGKIWDVIKRVARTVLPVISGMGPIGAAIGGVGSGILSVGETIEGLRKPKPSTDKPAEELERDRPPAAAVERAQALVSAPRVVVRKPLARKAARKIVKSAGRY